MTVHRDRDAIEFLDCETVRITGVFETILLRLHWWDEEGRLGTLAEPVGDVDGTETVVASEVFGEFPYGPVVSSVEAFEVGSIAVPGDGDLVESHPDRADCDERALSTYEGPGEPEAPP